MCRFVAGGEHDEEEIGTNDKQVDLIPLTGVDGALGKLIKLLNAFGEKLSGSSRRLAISIRSIIISSRPNNWDPHKKVSTAILIESLQDSLNAKYGFEDEWEVVKIAARVNTTLLLPSLAA